MAHDESSSFVSMKVPELQNFLKARDIQIALDGKKRKKAELLELCKNAAEKKVPKVGEEIELKDDLIKSKITLPGGKLLPNPLSLQFWTHNFTNIPDFRFPDIYHDLVGKDGYDEACLRSYKNLRGFRLYMDGHTLLTEYLEIAMKSDRSCTISTCLTSVKINSSKVVRRLFFATLFDRGFLLKVDSVSFITVPVLQFLSQRFQYMSHILNIAIKQVKVGRPV